MIKPKPKTCSFCNQIKPLWTSNPKSCKECWRKNSSGSQTLKKGQGFIKKVSDKQQKLNTAYLILRNQFINNHPICMAQWEGCIYKATECHHAQGRIGELLLDATKFKALCHNCHSLIELQPHRAKREGLSESRLNK